MAHGSNVAELLYQWIEAVNFPEMEESFARLAVSITFDRDAQSPDVPGELFFFSKVRLSAARVRPLKASNSFVFSHVSIEQCG